MISIAQDQAWLCVVQQDATIACDPHRMAAYACRGCVAASGPVLSLQGGHATCACSASGPFRGAPRAGVEASCVWATAAPTQRRTM